MAGTIITNLPTANSVADTDKVLAYNSENGAVGVPVSTLFAGRKLTKTQLLPSVIDELNTPVQLLDNLSNYLFFVIAISPSATVVGPGNHQEACIAQLGSTVSVVSMESPSVYISVWATFTDNTITMTKANKSGWSNAKITGLWGYK